MNDKMIKELADAIPEEVRGLHLMLDDRLAIAEILHNLGYRKEGEIAKEILGEFYLWIGQDFDDIPNGGFIHVMKEDFKRRMNELYKRYSVEAENEGSRNN